MNKSRALKKAQTEIFGLAIIVVLLAFGMVLLLSNGSKSAPANNELNNEIADKFINTLLKTTTDCNSLTIQKLIEDAADYAPTGSIYCGDVSSRDYLNTTISLILEQSMDKWKRYELIIYSDKNKESQLLYFNSTVCKSRTMKEYPLGGSSAIVELDICT